MNLFCTFVIATLNEEVFLKDNDLTSRYFEFLKSSYYEFIIVDGCSTDFTLSLLPKHEKILIKTNPIDNGIYSAWNFGLKYAKGMYISFLGIDDCPNFDFYEKIRKNRENQKYFLIYGNNKIVSKNLFKIKFGKKNSMIFNSYPIFDIPHQGCLNHKSLFKENNFSINYKIVSDFKFYLDVIKFNKLNIKRTKYVNYLQTIISEGFSRNIESNKTIKKELNFLYKEFDIKFRFSLKSFVLYYLSFNPVIYNLFIQIYRKVYWKKITN